MKLQENQLFANRYLLQQKIGIGGFSEVWKAADEYIPGMTLALKIYATERGLDKESIELFSGEYMMTKSLRHKHLVEVIYYDVYQQSPYLVMPFYSCGSLAKSIHDKGLLSEDQIARLMLEIGDALNYLHTQDPPVLHRDIKPDNILIDDTGKYLLSDFGISRRVRHTIAKHTGKGSEDSMSIAYSAPERFSKNPQATEASDIFSLGVMFYQVCTGFLPWDENGGIALLRGAEIPDIPLNYSRKLNQIINQCMEVDSAKRPTAGQLKEWANTFLQEGYWKMNPDKAEIKKNKSKYLLPAVIGSIMLILIFCFIWFNNEGSKETVAEEKVKSEQVADINSSNNSDANSGQMDSIGVETESAPMPESKSPIQDKNGKSKETRSGTKSKKENPSLPKDSQTNDKEREEVRLQKKKAQEEIKRKLQEEIEQENKVKPSEVH